MGKGFNNYMTKKFFHPSSKDNIKRKWMAEQKTAYEKKKQEDLMAQYQKEQEVLSNRALLGDEKAKVGLSFMYDAPPGLKKKEDTEPQQEVKFEWQRKYNAPREAYAKDDDTIRDQPFGIEVRNVRCIKCRQWGHVNTDKICPLYGKDLTAEPELPESSSGNLLKSLGSDGLALKNSILAKMIGVEDDAQHQILAEADEEDPEVQFLKSLTPKQKKKLLKKLNKLQSSGGKGVSKKSKKKKKHRHSHHSDDSDSDDEKSGRHKKKEKHRKRKNSSSESEDSDHEMQSKSKKEKHRKNKKRSSDSEDSSSEKRHSHRDNHSLSYSSRQREDKYRDDRNVSPVRENYRDERRRSPRRDNHREERRRSPARESFRSRDRDERRRSRSPVRGDRRKEDSRRERRRNYSDSD